jgi:spermidine synthase
VGTSVTFLIFAGILLLLSIIYFISSKGKHSTKKIVVSVFVFVVCCAFGANDSFAFWESDLTYEGESVYNYLQVKEDAENVILSTNVLFGVQSILKKNGELTGMYYDYAMAAPLMAGVEEKENLKVLILGMGTGTFATQASFYFDNMEVEGVEIDDKITDLARAYFELPKETKVTTYDGRAYLNAVDTKYDVILVDAYQDITIPFQMSSVEFFTLVKDHLTEDGVMVVNMNMRGSDKGSINDYLTDTIAAVFDTVYTADVSGSTNRELFASENTDILATFQENRLKIANQNLLQMMELVANGLTKYEAGNYLMTDDKAPVELLGMQVIDELIQDEVAYYRNIYDENGISGVIEMLQ